MSTATDPIQAIEDALGLLLTVCDGARSEDGAGFNKFDGEFARSVWEWRGRWTPKQAYGLWKMLRKYRRQLAGLGMDFENVPAPPDPAQGFAHSGKTAGNATAASPQGVTIARRTDGVIVVRFPYSQEMVEKIRSIQGRQWDGLNKEWHIPDEPLAIGDLLRFAKEVQAEVPASVVEGFISGQKAIEEAHAQAAESVKDSVATDADFRVEGLGGTLMPFQRAGVKYASERRRCLIADSMGLGKTVQALATLKHLNALPALVICPASLRMNWMREAKKWLAPCYSVPYEINSFSDISVINYDILAKWSDHIIERIAKGKIKAVIFDEMHLLKNHKAQRSVAARHIAQALHKAQGENSVVLGLTGTPILNRPGELLHLLQILGRLDEVGGFKTFRDRYLVGDFRGRGANLEELQVLCRSKFLIRREKSQVLKDLPPKTRNTIELPIADYAAYKRVESAPLRDDEAAAIVRIGELRRESARQKLGAAIEWVREFVDEGRKLILFTVHRDIQAEYMKAFPDAAHILGDDDGSTRQRNVDRFQEDPECKLIVCSLKAAGVGLTLTAASDVAFHEFGWTPGDMDQAEDRAHRIGQRDSVTCWYLKAQGIDESMLELIEDKREVGRQLLELDRTASVDKDQIKGRLVKQILEKARKEGRLVA